VSVERLDDRESRASERAGHALCGISQPGGQHTQIQQQRRARSAPLLLLLSSPINR
jgi:hypothetical protein